MKKLCLPALGLLTWVMLVPPPRFPLVKDPKGNYAVDVKAPIGNWLVFRTYRNPAACRGDLKDMPRYFVCADRDRLVSGLNARRKKTAVHKEGAATTIK
jgi:hypothetical protein